MNYRKCRFRTLFFILLLSMVFSRCDNHPGKIEKDTVKNPAKLEEHVGDDMKKMLQYALENKDKLNDTTILNYPKLLDSLYESNGYVPLWSDKDHWQRHGDSLFYFIENSKTYGLFPSDYHYSALSFVHRILGEDTLARKNAALWARADLLYTDAFFTLVKDLKQGRLAYDSITLRKDSMLPDELYRNVLTSALHTDSFSTVLDALQPKYKGYDSLKTYLREFLASARFRKLTWLEYPYKDSAGFYRDLTHRLQEVGYIDSAATNVDTSMLTRAIRNYQSANKLKVTGKVNADVINMMDNSDWEKFKRVAITMDRYKHLPDTLPSTYVWVNLPAFDLHVVNDDTTVFSSKVIVGAPKTRTPLLTSEISNFITYPQWTVPNSIIFKEMLPQIKRNTDYLAKQNLMVVDWNDSVRDPATINWKRLNKNNFPYQLKQRQGDDNSLGVMKFNFRNKYDVYLHDTNVRWMFGKSYRALSHGCVRVKEWQKLADFLVRNDTIKYKPDTLKAWISRQEKHTVYGFARVPIFLRYFSVEGVRGKLLFHEDIYGEDRQLRDRYFADKPIN
ncbi:MAG TPA: L,D-transpeptidase family protein [Puia sp.]